MPRQEDHSQCEASLGYSVRLCQHTRSTQTTPIFPSVFVEHVLCARHTECQRGSNNDVITPPALKVQRSKSGAVVSTY